MRLKFAICQLATAVFFSFLPALVNAQLLPPAIQSCVDQGQCTQPTPLPSLDPSGAISGFSYTESGIEKVLMLYEIEGTLTSTLGNTTTFRDLVWLSVQREYDTRSFDQHEMTLFGIGSDAAIPNPLGLSYEHPISFATEGLLLGTGNTGLMGSLRNPPPGLPPSMFDYPLVTCRAIGCYAQAVLNLVGLQFEQDNGVARLANQSIGTLNNDVLLTRTTGFEGDDFGNGAFENTLTVRISETPAAIPEPSSGFAFILGGGMIAFPRRRDPTQL